MRFFFQLPKLSLLCSFLCGHILIPATPLVCFGIVSWTIRVHYLCVHLEVICSSVFWVSQPGPLGRHFCAEWETRQGLSSLPHRCRGRFFQHRVWRRLAFLKCLPSGTSEEKRESRWLSLCRFISEPSIFFIHVCFCAGDILVFFCDFCNLKLAPWYFSCSIHFTTVTAWLLGVLPFVS